MKKILGKILTLILDVTMPRQCVGCGIYDQWACQHCLKQQIKIEYTHDVDLCNNLQSILTLGLYSNPFWRECIRLLKFHKVQEMAEVLASELANTIWNEQHELLKHNRVIIVPIPLHKKRYQERGFNQCELIGAALSDITGWPIFPDLIKRIKHAPSQTSVSKDKRTENVDQAFVANINYHDLQDVHLLLIDDVITTGATLKQAVNAVTALSPNSIHALAIARGH